MDELTDVIDSLPDAIVVVDEEGIIQHANEHITPILGYTPDELTGVVVEELLLEADREQHVTFREQYLTDPSPRPMGGELDLYARHRDGSEVPVEISLGPVTHDGDRYVLATIVDITDRKERERELERQQEQFRYVEQVADIGYWELDAQTEPPYSGQGSDGVFDIYERVDDEALNVEEGLDFYHPDDQPELQRAIEKALSEGEPYDLELRLITTNDRERWVHTTGEPVTRDGEIVKLRGTLQDITERKHQEKALERQNERLEEFSGFVSHDLRNPLNVAQGRLELATEECDSEHLDAIERAHERMQTLIDDLLSLARTGDTVTAPTAVTLESLIEGCWTTVDTSDATLQTDIDRTIQADESRLKQLFENLFRNAVEHAEGEIVVTVGELESGFYVEDTGPGIPESDRADVFEAGYSTTEDGTGFGLNIVKQIVDAHDWQISAVAGTDGGARFEITGVTTVE